MTIPSLFAALLISTNAGASVPTHVYAAHPGSHGDEDTAHPRDPAPLEAPGGVMVGETLEIHAWAGAGYTAQQEAEGETLFGPDIRMARMAARVHYDHQGDIFAQFEMSDGTARLLDARVSIEMGDHFELRAGRMKASTSAEYLIPQPILHHVNRARLVDWVPTRHVGVEATYTPFAPGFDVQGALFNVAGTSPVEGAGTLVVGRLRFEPHHTLQLNLSYTEHIEGHQANPAYAVEHDELVDMAVESDLGHWMFHLEGLARFEHEVNGRGLVTFVSVGRHFGDDPEGFGVEPVVALDHIVESQGLTENAAAGLNLLFHGHHLMQLTEVELHKLPDGRTNRAVYVQLRGGV